jgi:hypothetical protein
MSNGGVKGITNLMSLGFGSGVWNIDEAYQINRSDNWKAKKGTIESDPLSSPAEAAQENLPAGTYFFKSASMPNALSLQYQPNYEDGSGFVLVFRSTYQTAATVNHINKGIPFSKILVQRNTRDYKGMVRFSTNQSYVTTVGSGITGSSGTNSFGVTPVLLVFLGSEGAHGIYNPSQGPCNWQSNIAGSIGAGYTATTGCGAFPDNLIWGANPSNNGPVYSNTSGTWEHWVTW